QTLTGLAAFQAKLGAFGTLVPASRRDAQLPPGKRRQSDRQSEVLDPRQLWFRESSLADSRPPPLPPFRRRYRSRPGASGRARLSRRKPGRERRARRYRKDKDKNEDESEAGEHNSGNHSGPSAFPGCFLKLLSQ